MIRKECFEEEWIEKVCSNHRFRHPALVEKVIRAYFYWIKTSELLM